MQTAIAPKIAPSYYVETYAVETIVRPGAQPRPKTPSRLLTMLARKWDMIGVIAVMVSSAVYAVSQLMTLAH